MTSSRPPYPSSPPDPSPPRRPPGHDPFAQLNDAQRAAVEHGIGDGDVRPLLVIAGAGSGKTMTLAARVARLVLAGADPQRVLLLTFSRRAAQEMERRVGQGLHQALGLPSTTRPPALPWSGTFHSVGARLLRELAGSIGLAPGFTVHDRADAEDLMGLVRQELGLAQAKNRFPLKGTCLSIYSRVVNRGSSLEEVLHETYPWCLPCTDELKQLFRAYVATKQDQQALDYDDLLLYWSQAMAEPGLAHRIGSRFDHVLVDEYQDTNPLQAKILLAMKPDGRGLTVVGDDAQAIYSFRAAEVRNILDFPTQFGTGARVVTLERNYRSTQAILDASNRVISLAGERFAKTLWTDRSSSDRPRLVTVEDEAAQAQWVADRLLEQREAGLKLRSQAVLFRSANHSAALELELTRRNIPFVKYGGLRFLEAAHVKDVLSVLRWAENPRSRLAGFRAALLVPGIGPASARRVLDALAQPGEACELLQACPVPAAARADWVAFAALYRQLRQAPGAWPAELAAVNRWYEPQLARLHDDARVRFADLEQLARIAAAFPSRERFLTELTLDPPDATSDESAQVHRDEDYAILSTIHSAKGQEWNAVYVLNVVDGCIPSDMATDDLHQIDEERRLLYVAMTRARQHLALLVPQRFYVTQQRALGPRHLYGSLTRFIPHELRGLFDPETGAAAAAGGAEAAAGATARDLPGAAVAAAHPFDVAARVRSAWT